MKPSWDTAPHWANYLAQDENGNWYWYQNQPYTDDEDIPEWFNDGGRYEAAYAPNRETWKNTLEERPA